MRMFRAPCMEAVFASAAILLLIASGQTAAAEEPETSRRFFEAGITLATTLTSWTLVMIGGSILAILSTSYYRPRDLWFRASYLIFIPAWLLLSLSLREGAKVQGVYLAALFQRKPDIDKLMFAQNGFLAGQQDFMMWGLGCFGVWLTIYLLWWIFNKESKA